MKDLDWYAGILLHVMEQGEDRDSRNGRTRAVFGRTLKFDDVGEFVPLTPLRALPWRWIVEELLWMLRGETSVTPLRARGVTMWDAWADEDGELGPTYGKQLRSFCGVDQLARLLDGLRKDPTSRRHLLTLWNPVDVLLTKVPPCQVMMQFYVDNAKRLHLKVDSRSSDATVGLPFDVASHALLLNLVARAVGLAACSLKVDFGDLHVYEKHWPAAFEIASRTQRLHPTLRLNMPAGGGLDALMGVTAEDCSLLDYEPHPKMTLEAVA